MAVRSPRVDLDLIRPGDIVLVSQRGRLFHATVKGRGTGALVVEPHDSATRARSARPTEIVDHWLHAESAEGVPREQLALEDIVTA